jgi:uncharacterized phage protein gp47/JayE
MAYFPPVITAAGLSLPVFNDIQSAILSAFQSIYGSTTYLGNDSADYQWISALALKLNDNMQLCQLAYNARSPLTAIGSDLDSILKINGLTRLSSSNSSATLLLTGLAGTPIYSAIIADVNGILWQLPPTVTIGPGGSVSATAVCQQGGPISAAPDTIKTPVGGFTAGWNTVTNPSAANVGTPVESDSNARARQSVSVALPSSTRLAGTIAEVKAVAGVTLTNILENQTGVTDAYGNLGHSMTAVVMGGTDLDVATAIFNNRGIGCNTIGATAVSMTEVPVTDPNSGNVMTIGFVRPQTVPIYVTLGIHGLTSNYNSTMQTNIQNAVANYLNGLQIGEEVTQSALYGAALSAMPSLLQPDFSIRSLQLGTAPSPTGTTDVAMNFWQVSSGLVANVIINAV